MIISSFPSIKIDKNHFLFRYKEKNLIDLDFLSLELTNQQIIGGGKKEILNL